jgi:hypothetical protein
LARDYDPIIGNKILLDEIKNNPQLIPCFVLMPDITGEFPDVNFYLRDNNVRAVKTLSKASQIFSLMNIHAEKSSSHLKKMKYLFSLKPEGVLMKSSIKPPLMKLIRCVQITRI